MIIFSKKAHHGEEEVTITSGSEKEASEEEDGGSTDEEKKKTQDQEEDSETEDKDDAKRIHQRARCYGSDFSKERSRLPRSVDAAQTNQRTTLYSPSRCARPPCPL